MKIRVGPQTASGRFSAIFSLLFIVLIALKISVHIHVPTPCIAALGIAGFLIGLIAVLKNGDRALLTLLSIPAGLLILIWGTVEAAFPH